MHPVIPFGVAALLFGIGVYGVLVRRNAVLLLMAVELMLNAVNLVFVTADTSIVLALGREAALPRSGQVFALFVIVIAAAEVGVGLAIVLQLYRMRRSVALDEISLDAVPAETAASEAGTAAPQTGTAETGTATGTTAPQPVEVA
jgi:NADH-quinone oxidoreductase subunit K